MCRVAGWTIALGSLVLGIAPARAQSTEELARRLDNELARRRVAWAALMRHGKVREPAVFTDTLALANRHVTIVTTTDLRGLADTGLARTQVLLDRHVGAALSLIAPATVSVRVDTTQRDVRPTPLTLGYITSTGGTVNQTVLRSPDSIAHAIVQQLVEGAMHDRRTSFAQWRRGSVLLDRPLSTHDLDWGLVRLDLVSSDALVGRRCYDGDVAACAMTLGLRESSDPATEWYDAAGRRALVRRMQARTREHRAAETRGCIDGRDDDCLAVMRFAPNGLLDAPGDGFDRASLLRHALELGGDRATERLLLNTGSAADALAAAAGMPIDSLLHSWQQNVRTKAIHSQDLSIHLAVVALGWVALLAFMAYRSSRWR